MSWQLCHQFLDHPRSIEVDDFLKEIKKRGLDHNCPKMHFYSCFSSAIAFLFLCVLKFPKKSQDFYQLISFHKCFTLNFLINIFNFLKIIRLLEKS